METLVTRPGRPTSALILNETERETLRAWIRRPSCPQALVLRARIILSCADGRSNTETAEELLVTQQTVGKWRQRFIEKRLGGLVDEPRPGTPRKLSDSDIERVLALTLESTPENAPGWSTRSLAEASGLSHASVHRIWQAFNVTRRRISASPGGGSSRSADGFL